jgi:hypothetical protein
MDNKTTSTIKIIDNYFEKPTQPLPKYTYTSFPKPTSPYTLGKIANTLGDKFGKKR